MGQRCCCLGPCAPAATPSQAVEGPCLSVVAHASPILLGALNPARQGWLWKARAYLGGAKRRWFVLLRPAANSPVAAAPKETLLLFYSSFTSERPRGVLPMAACSIAPSATSRLGAGKGCAFEVRCDGYKHETMCLGTDDPRETTAWIKALLPVGLTPGATPPPAIRPA